jgi:hypothetical protein
MKIKKYTSYEEYKEEQIKTNIKKINNIFITNEEINFITEYIKLNIQNPSFGICHGVRNGYEVNELKKILKFKIIGTEISTTANKFKNVIQWDFHKIKNEWLEKTDFIYSNSLDHSFDPITCVNTWMSCLNKTGILFICWTTAHVGKALTADCFSATEKEYYNILSKYNVEKIRLSNRTIFIVRKI